MAIKTAECRCLVQIKIKMKQTFIGLVLLVLLMNIGQVCKLLRENELPIAWQCGSLADIAKEVWDRADQMDMIIKAAAVADCSQQFEGGGCRIWNGYQCSYFHYKR